MSLCKGWTQGGSNADVVLADSYLKNITEGVDWAKAYEAVVSDAEVEPPNWDIEGRGGLRRYVGSRGTYLTPWRFSFSVFQWIPRTFRSS